MKAEGFILEVIDEIGSTNDALKARAAAGAPGDLALLARRQTGGRGRLGRSWQSIEGNLNLSALLRPVTLGVPGHWSVLSVVALVQAVAGFLPDPAVLRVKWPNDLLLSGGKLAGILLEAGLSPAPWLVIGFGVNLTTAPDGLGRKVACLADACMPPTPEMLARDLLRSLTQWQRRYESEDFPPIRDAWLGFAGPEGETQMIAQGGRLFEGGFRGLGDDAALLLDGPDGPIAVVAGEAA